MSEGPDADSHRDSARTTSSIPVSKANQPWIEVYGSRGLTAWMTGHRTSLAFSTYQTGKLFFVGTGPDLGLSIFERTFDRAMGLYGDGQSLLLSTTYQLWRFQNALRPGESHQERDRPLCTRYEE